MSAAGLRAQPAHFILAGLCASLIGSASAFAQEATLQRGSGQASNTKAALSERTAVIGVLDKRQGSTADFTLKPGERFSFGRISGVLRSCERTQPHERKQSAAFLQVVEQPAATRQQPDAKRRLVFSGWLFAESPSLNPFVHPVYDVWLKSCTMRFPDGPRPPSTSGGRKTASPASATAPASKPAPSEPAQAPAAPVEAAVTPG